MNDLKQDISCRLAEVRQHLKMSVSDLAIALGVQPQTVRDYENGKSVLGGDKVAKLIELGVDANWLLAGPGYDSVPFNDFLTVAKKYQHISLSSKRNQLNQDHQEYEPDTIFIEQYPDVRAAAGMGQITPTDAVSISIAINASDWHSYVGLSTKYLKIISVYGDSMKPTLQHGDQILVDTACHSFIDDALYVIQQRDNLRVKRIKLRLDGSIEVKSDNNKEFTPEIYTPEEAADFRIVGKVLPFKFGKFDL
jgi:phage repressor protein C with HTH and peptisase S24 domain/DNA-binding XRE family transcriptional regulator